MRSRPVATLESDASPRPTSDRAAVLASVVAFVVVLVLLGGLVVLVALDRGGARPGIAGGALPSPSGDSFLYAELRDAPPIDLVDSAGRPFSLASLRGQQVLVFFGYTHCPDVCPATIGNVSEVLGKVGPGTRAVFASIDPERDTTTWLAEYERFLPDGFIALTGTPAQVRSTADAWGVRYARVEMDSKSGYSMSHTANVYLVDAAGRLRAAFPFGTSPEAMIDVLGVVAASTPTFAPAAGVVSVPPGTAAPGTAAPGTALSGTARPGAPPPSAASTPTPNPTPAGTAVGGGALRPEIVSTSVWAGETPVILALNDDAGRLNDPSIQAIARLAAPDGSAVGPATEAVVVRPPGTDRMLYVATLAIPAPGPWRLEVTATAGGEVRTGWVDFTALDPGTTAAIGEPAPTAHTPTLDDVGGHARAVTTDPAPYLKLSQRSTTDALATHTPFVLVVDSVRFRVTPACGKAVVMARYLIFRWSDVAFIHLEPYRYTVVADTAVLSGDIQDPPVGPVAAAWGVDSVPWGARSMPWVFVVDGDGIVRAKYQGLMGSDDVDVMLSLITGRM